MFILWPLGDKVNIYKRVKRHYHHWIVATSLQATNKRVTLPYKSRNNYIIPAPEIPYAGGVISFQQRDGSRGCYSRNFGVECAVGLCNPTSLSEEPWLLPIPKLYYWGRRFLCNTRSASSKTFQDFGFLFDVNQTVTIASNPSLSKKSGNHEQKLQK